MVKKNIPQFFAISANVIVYYYQVYNLFPICQSSFFVFYQKNELIFSQNVDNIVLA